MALLSLNEGGLWFLDYEVTPVEFWPYTTFVTEVVMTGPRNEFKILNEELIRLFTEAGIRAYAENKCAFGVKDRRNRMWYLGFKDFRFDLGSGVQPDKGLKPNRANPSCPKCNSNKNITLGPMSYTCSCGTSFTV